MRRHPHDGASVLRREEGSKAACILRRETEHRLLGALAEHDGLERGTVPVELRELLVREPEVHAAAASEA